jgi:FMN phosphatase YigB (HAD superfamily)
LDAEGTLYIPHRGRSTWEFWADPSPEHAKDFFVLDEGVAEALRSLRDRVDSLCIVSRNSKPILDALLDDFGIRDYFDEVILNGNKGKQIVKYMAERGYDRRDAVMVGDTPTLDLYPVKKAGVEAILVDRPYNRQADAERIKGVRELPSWLRIADIAERSLSPRNATLDDFFGTTATQERPGPVATGC